MFRPQNESKLEHEKNIPNAVYPRRWKFISENASNPCVSHPVAPKTALRAFGKSMASFPPKFRFCRLNRTTEVVVFPKSSSKVESSSHNSCFVNSEHSNVFVTTKKLTNNVNVHQNLLVIILKAEIRMKVDSFFDVWKKRKIRISEVRQTRRTNCADAM